MEKVREMNFIFHTTMNHSTSSPHMEASTVGKIHQHTHSGRNASEKDALPRPENQFLRTMLLKSNEGREGERFRPQGRISSSLTLPSQDLRNQRLTPVPSGTQHTTLPEQAHRGCAGYLRFLRGQTFTSRCLGMDAAFSVEHCCGI